MDNDEYDIGFTSNIRVLKDYFGFEPGVQELPFWEKMASIEQEESKAGNIPNLQVKAIISPIEKTTEGQLIKALTIPWKLLVNSLMQDWESIYQIPSYKWEELVAGAFELDGFDEVILTPRSWDKGRDVIAVKRGIGSIRIISSVKAPGKGNKPSADDIRSFVGALLSDPSASKGIFTSTSDLPNTIHDKNIQALIPYRLELLGGTDLKKWFEILMSKN